MTIESRRASALSASNDQTRCAPKKVPPEIIILHEGPLKSWLVDASTFCLFAGLVGLGWVLNSSAMEWCGAIIAFVTCIGKSSVKDKRLTISQARARLDEIEKEAA